MSAAVESRGLREDEATGSATGRLLLASVFMEDPALHGDCEKCAGLCCVALAFERGAAFAFDKAAGEACVHLAENRCAIHAEREASGFRGCVDYDCHGAGQRATALFSSRAPGRNGPTGDASAEPALMEAFRVLRDIHDLLLLLSAAQRLPLDTGQEQQLAALWAALEPADGWSVEALGEFDRGPLPGSVASFLKSLRSRARARLPMVGTKCLGGAAYSRRR